MMGFQYSIECGVGQWEKVNYYSVYKSQVLLHTDVPKLEFGTMVKFHYQKPRNQRLKLGYLAQLGENSAE